VLLTLFLQLAAEFRIDSDLGIAALDRHHHGIAPVPGSKQHGQTGFLGSLPQFCSLDHVQRRQGAVISRSGARLDQSEQRPMRSNRMVANSRVRQTAAIRDKFQTSFP